MTLLSSKNLIKIHLLSAAFMLPIAMVFLITGCIYFIFEFDGNYTEAQHSIAIDQPLPKDVAAMKSLLEPQLMALGYPVPDGWAEIVELDKAPYSQFEWFQGLDWIIRLKASDDPGLALLSVSQASFYKKLMLLHMANGDNVFRLYAVLFAGILFSMFITGYIIAWRMPRYRRLMTGSSIASILLFVLIVAIQ